jgi:hypothetical protein
MVNFPFEDKIDHAVAIGGVLTTVLRGGFDVAPMGLYRAPDVGSGKSFTTELRHRQLQKNESDPPRDRRYASPTLPVKQPASPGL